ncbi:hypothetical protein DICSQDRAFT_111328 [Dichomitus squalens LYAD-421 SS1]|uniref:[histone H3]-trimethyl-L-lysine(9) demethylase n=1 Tax=Dichomitus squalens (strain LYAD-421) TaxID=732165 RepID=R7SNF8_DICSQ|nr:uncharacterized protein DICSQDRAFT_111328 [Dichomitus squalens LYAD-421 SS1]EJF57709.1 hypothetical protein DICSQDRAFT_111328 [Dichomitus squalens LYAD-421 SS1]
MSTSSQSASRARTRSPTPYIPAQPDHFYGNETVQLPPSPNSDGRDWLDPADYPTAQQGIPVFRPTMDEFQDFEGYMTRVEPWGMRSGIVKIIPPKEWTERLPSIVPQLHNVALKNPIEQHMIGQGGRFHQQNIEKRRTLSVREWAELCAHEELRAPGVNDVGVRARATNGAAKRTRRTRKAAGTGPGANNDADARMSETAEPEQVKREQEDESIPLEPERPAHALVSPPNSNRTLSPSEHDDAVVESLVAVQPGPGSSISSKTRHPLAEEEEEEEDGDGTGDAGKRREEDEEAEDVEELKPKRGRGRGKGRRAPQTREVRKAEQAARADKDREFLDSFDPRTAWLPSNTDAASYTTDFCKELERMYWRNCGWGKAPWYGADMQGSLFTDETTAWNVAHLPSALTRLLPASSKGLPGVNTPYLYFGMWRATFAWHVEDMDLFSINYIHFGAPKFWYAMPQARANALEQTMRGLFPGADKNCSQFLRHKSYLASPNELAKTFCRPNYLVQHAGEFVITFPRGYHAGFNLGFNCAESVNFALESWIDLGRKAKACGCVNFSVRIDVDRLLQDRAAENIQVYRNGKAMSSKSELEIEPAFDKTANETKHAKIKASRKRKADGDAALAKTKIRKINSTSVTASQPIASSSTQSAMPSIKHIRRVMLKVGPPPPPKDQEFPCCLCASSNKHGLLRVHDPPAWWYSADNADAKLGPCMAHEECAVVVPETWVDEIERNVPSNETGQGTERVVFGVDAVTKDRWNLKCTACTKLKNRAHGAKIQCTSAKCPKAFHVSCARDGHANGIVYEVLREVEKEVILLDNQPPIRQPTPPPPPPGPGVLVLHPGHASVVPQPSHTPAGDQPMQVDPHVPFHDGGKEDGPSAQREETPSPQVLKTIRKMEVELLCHQHNPATLLKKKEANEKRIRDRVMSLAEGSLIKLRITNGIFEVQLLRVIEDRRVVEVLWDADKDIKREFSWKSVLVGGNTDNIVAQKPSDLSPKPSPAPSVIRPTPSTSRATSTHRPLSAAPVASTSSSHASPPVAPSTSQQPPAPVYNYPPQPRTATYPYGPGHWSYPYAAIHPSYTSASGQSSSYGSSAYSHYNPYTHANSTVRPPYPQYAHYPGYNGYAPPPTAGRQYPPQPLPARTDAQQKGLSWQRPYTGPKESAPRPPPLTVPAVPQYQTTLYAPIAPAPAPQGSSYRERPSSSQGSRQNGSGNSK